MWEDYAEPDFGRETGCGMWYNKVVAEQKIIPDASVLGEPGNGKAREVLFGDERRWRVWPFLFWAIVAAGVIYRISEMLNPR